MLEHKADAAQLAKLGGQAKREICELDSVRGRLETAEAALSNARRDATEAFEQARASSVALQQLQAATDKHWQITRTGREEQAQLVKAVRALLLDAELRVASDAVPPNNPDTLGEYGQFGWSSPSARHSAQAASGAAGGGSKRGGGRLPAATPRSGNAVSGGGAIPIAAEDVLTRRRRLLACASTGLPEGSVTLPDALALPGGMATGGFPSYRGAARTRTELMGHALTPLPTTQ